MPVRLNIPPLTRILLILIIGLSLIYQAVKFRLGEAPLLVLIPGASLFFPWVYATSAFVEENVVTLLIGSATIFYGGRYLERAWGSAETVKFLAVITVIPYIITGILYRIVWTSTGLKSLGTTTIQGSIPIQAAFLVAFKQLVPEHTVTILKGVIKIRVKHFPAIFLVANTISGFVFFTDTAAILSWFGFLSSWTYLRFYKAQDDISGPTTGGNAIRGDASETFAFAYFWPDVVHGPIAALSDAVFELLVAIRVCSPFSAEDIETSNQQANARGDGLPNIMNPTGARRGGGGGSKREEAERRRALALKALDQRLAAAANRPPPVNPTSAPREMVPPSAPAAEAPGPTANEQNPKSDAS